MAFQLKDGIYVSSIEDDIFYPSEGNDSYYKLEDTSFWFSHRNKVILLFVQKFLRPKSSFLDAGGGNGFVSREIQSFGYDVSLLESGPGVFNAKKRGIKKIYRGNILNFEIGKRFEGIGLFDVVEHVEDLPALYSSLERLLDSNGYLFITVPSYNWLWSQEDVAAQHVRRYTKTRIERELRDNGFEVITYSYFFSILIPLIFVFRSIPYLLGIKEKRSSETCVAKEHSNSATGLLLSILKIEFYLLKIMKIPFGSSLLVVARKRDFSA